MLDEWCSCQLLIEVCLKSACYSLWDVFCLYQCFLLFYFNFFENFWGIFLIPTTFTHAHTHTHDPQLPPTTHDLRKSAILPVLSNRILCLMILSCHHYKQFTSAFPPNGTLWWIYVSNMQHLLVAAFLKIINWIMFGIDWLPEFIIKKGTARYI